MISLASFNVYPVNQDMAMWASLIEVSEKSTICCCPAEEADHDEKEVETTASLSLAVTAAI